MQKRRGDIESLPDYFITFEVSMLRAIDKNREIY